MGQSDLKLRNKAIPFQAQIHQLNSTELSSQRISMASPAGDLLHLVTLLAGNTRRYFPVRFLRPHGSNIIQAYLTVRIRLAAGNAVQVYVAPAIFQDALDTKTLDTTLEASIKNYHQLLTGSAAPISVPAGGTLTIDALNMSKLLTNNPASPLYSKHFFGVTLLFVDPPVMTGTWDVQKFKIDASANFGGL